MPQKLLVGEKRNSERNCRDVRSKSRESSSTGQGEIAADCGTTWGFENWSVILATISGAQEWPEQEQFQWGSGEISWLDRLTASEGTEIRMVNTEEWHSAWRETGCKGGDTESALRNLFSYLTQPWHSSVNIILVIKFYCIFQECLFPDNRFEMRNKLVLPVIIREVLIQTIIERGFALEQSRKIRWKLEGKLQSSEIFFFKWW